ncbi:tetratricopeptide repeat protein [Nocardia takedensis]|uniref:serine/threonine-protein kinase n=1 Tax=Nocardia takedensis TaxID=259390 RepID=UPI0002F1D8D0|nr:serine/threonine-protein kinase [Nocardia takedensis]
MVASRNPVESPFESRPSRRSPLRRGLGLVVLPEVPPIEPETAVLAEPVVPEDKRFCWKCAGPVGRSDGNRAGVTHGWCAQCGAQFGFRPALAAGEVVADQYEIRGCLAHGGFGWVYLARDRRVGGRWVVLKGLRNPRDPEAHVTALAERQFLSEVVHPAIVKIFNFVTHRDAGYIVMEYIGGRSLGALLEQRGAEPIPVAEAIAYVLGILPALDHLHALGLAYNDLKPDNVMVSRDEVTLIDLGAVAALRSGGVLEGTPGFQAPEIARTGPTVASDIYSVGRTLAALALPGGWDAEEPTSSAHPEFAMLLRRAVHADPRRRFASIAAMYRQLEGVLRIVLARDTGRDHPQVSAIFGAVRTDFGAAALPDLALGNGRAPGFTARDLAAALPIPMTDPDDPAADVLAGRAHADPGQAREALRITRAVRGEPTESFERESALIETRVHLDLGATAAAREILDGLRAADPTEWRVDWFEAILALRTGRLGHAHTRFEVVHAMVPGELAPVLAMAATAELLAAETVEPERESWRRRAAERYRTVWRTDATVVTAAFGSARSAIALGEPSAALEVLRRVRPETRGHDIARMGLAALLVSRPAAELTRDVLDEAARQLPGLPHDRRLLELRAAVLDGALRWFRAGGRATDPADTVLGFPCTERGLRGGLEAALRALAMITPNRRDRFALVDRANAVRPHSWL